MFSFDVRAGNVNETVAKLNAIKANLGDKCITRAINETAKKARTAMVANITATYNIKKSVVTEWVDVVIARPIGNKMVASVTGNPYGRRKRALNLTRFLDQKAMMRQWRKGYGMVRPALQARILKAKGPKTYPHAFILNVPGNPVVERIGPGRGQLKGVFAVGVPQMFNTKRVQEPVQTAIPLWFNESFARNVRFYLSKL